MKEQEVREVLGLLEDAGMSASLCNTMVHVSSCPVRCGMPTLTGDDSNDESILLPQELVGHQPELFVPARGDSMADAGFNEGDLLRVRLNMAAHDGDIVVACIDGATTVKVLFTDDSERRWLVPCNERYDAIPLTADSDLRILGVVVGVEKRVVRASSGDCMRAVRRTLAKQQPEPVMTEEQVDEVIRDMGAEVSNGRQWYAVYRALADHRLVAEDCYRDFCERVGRVVPGHAYPPVAKELGRMASLSFRKHVPLWDANNAPVHGARFADYLRIARLTSGRLNKLPTT
jgi:hypothetical protein